MSDKCRQFLALNWSLEYYIISCGSLVCSLLFLRIKLLQYGGDLSAKDGNGYTPLSILNEDRERFKSSLSK